MPMQPINQQATLDDRYRTLLTLWSALTISIGMFFLLTLMAPVENAVENKALSYALLAIGAVVVIASYFVKQRFLARSVNEQNIGLVQSGMVTASALCEAAAMLGLLDYFLTGNRYYYVLMIFAIIGNLLNFPRRDHLLAASYKNSQPKDLWK